jgi:hypothetical protein
MAKFADEVKETMDILEAEHKVHCFRCINMFGPCGKEECSSYTLHGYLSATRGCN